MKRFYFLQIVILAVLWWGSPVDAQDGSGNLPSVPKSGKAKSKTAKPKTAPKILTAKDPAKTEKIVFDQETEGKIDSVTAGRIPPNIYFQEYLLTASDADLFSIHISSATPVRVEMLDEKKNEVSLKHDEQAGTYRPNTPELTLPEPGEYRLRVLATFPTASMAPITYSLKLNHTGLTASGYQERLEQIINAFNLPGERKADETIAQLERLTQDDPNQPGGFEYLGMIYNEYKQDLPKASAVMLKAIQLGGAATFKITHDSRWRRPVREGKGIKFKWEDPRTSWLKISAKQLALADFETPTKTKVALNSSQIKEVTRPPVGPFVIFKHSLKMLKPETIMVGFASPGEAEAAVDLIKNQFLRKE